MGTVPAIWSQDGCHGGRHSDLPGFSTRHQLQWCIQFQEEIHSNKSDNLQDGCTLWCNIKYSVSFGGVCSWNTYEKGVLFVQKDRFFQLRSDKFWSDGLVWTCLIPATRDLPDGEHVQHMKSIHVPTVQQVPYCSQTIKMVVCLFGGHFKLYNWTGWTWELCAFNRLKTIGLIWIN